MADAIWYYAQGDDEHGPITAGKLKSLADSGKLNPDDLVWREGMDDWKPAREVARLFPNAPGKVPVSPPTEPTASTGAAPPSAPPVEAGGAVESVPRVGPTPEIRSRPRVSGRSTRQAGAGVAQAAALLQPLSLGRYIGQPLLLIGLVLVLLAKGCDSVGNRYVQRLSVRQELAQNNFKDDWDERRQALENERKEIRDKGELTADDRAKLDSIASDLSDMNEEMVSKRQELERGKWRAMRIAARDADANNKMWGFFREALFIFGTIVLTIGLLAVGFTGEGAQKWICLVMLAIVTFSLYVGGTAWVGTLTNLMR